MKALRTLLGIVLIPVAIATARAFFEEMAGVGLLSGTLRALERGVLVYALFHLMVMRPVYLYVLGHEMVHVLANWICGGKVVSFNVRPSGGSVVTSKTNAFIELSPYFVPFYTILLAPIFMVLKATGHETRFMSELFVFFVGVTLSFHFIMTAEVLRIEQPDILKSGWAFSFVLIFLGNLLLLMMIFSPMFDLSFLGFLEGATIGSRDLYVRIYEWTAEFVNTNKFW